VTDEGLRPVSIPRLFWPASAVSVKKVSPPVAVKKLSGLVIAHVGRSGSHGIVRRIAYWAVPQKTMASATVSAKTANPVAEPEPSSPAQASTLSKQIEVTGFRFVTPAQGKPEIHYIVVNHSPVN